MKAAIKVGSVKSIRRYPVKGMRGEDLDSAFISKTGIPHDRNYAFIDKNATNLEFPYFTPRLRNEMLLFVPEISQSGRVSVKTPENKAEFSIDDPFFKRFLEERFGHELELRYDRSGCYDTKPISIFGLPTLRELSKDLGTLEKERFRANIYVEWDSGEPFFEDSLVGKSIRIGSAILDVVKKNSRCAVPTLDPNTAKASPKIQKFIIETRDSYVGVYAIVQKEGSINIGDDIFLIQDSSQNKS